MNFDLGELVKRALKYFVEGLIVALAAFVIPQKKLRLDECLLIALTAAATFSILDTYLPSLAMSARSGAGFGIGAPEGGMTTAYADGGYTWWTDFLFQGMFAATAATIVSGAVAERIKLQSFMLFTVLYVGITYPIVGSWKWGGGFLDQLGFYDFAGSTGALTRGLRLVGR